MNKTILLKEYINFKTIFIRFYGVFRFKTNIQQKHNKQNDEEVQKKYGKGNSKTVVKIKLNWFYDRLTFALNLIYFQLHILIRSA